MPQISQKHPKQTQAIYCLCLFLFVASVGFRAFTQHTGSLTQQGKTLFPLGFYELPKDETGLKAMADAGVNLLRCVSLEDLDRVAAQGMQGWVPLSLDAGVTDSFKATVNALVAHPALAVWEGPDEIVWNFTAYSGLTKTAGITKEDWLNQTPKAVNYAREKASVIMPNIHDCIAYIREHDPLKHPVWINEARESDALYVRQYMDAIDITGCDDYPVRISGDSDVKRVGRATQRWNMVGQGKPVWMVLQAFNWMQVDKEKVGDFDYPSFHESRFMAYDVIAHGAKGIMYWGAEFIDNPEFRQSIYALCAELSHLNDFLVAPNVENVSVTLVEAPDAVGILGVRCMMKRVGEEHLLILVNEDNIRHMGVQVNGLELLEGKELRLLYGDESQIVKNAQHCTRMQSFEVKVFSTQSGLESSLTDGRAFVEKGDRP